MVYQGVVQNGVVVFNGGEKPPEGVAVQVELSSPAVRPSIDPADTSSEDDPLLRMAELGGATGIDDLAVNIDHYLYGYPKAFDNGDDAEAER